MTFLDGIGLGASKIGSENCTVEKY